ncbi:MAG: hypothetical protein M5U22_08515 [Thermoleophilia bacterium]|nr:hypothetical protein [Thermoleophilia bacterium]
MAKSVKEATEGEQDLETLEYDYQFRFISGVTHAYYHGLDVSPDDVFGSASWSAMHVGRLCVVLSASSDKLYEHTIAMFARSKERMLTIAYGPLARATEPAAQGEMPTKHGQHSSLRSNLRCGLERAGGKSRWWTLSSPSRARETLSW